VCTAGEGLSFTHKTPLRFSQLAGSITFAPPLFRRLAHIADAIEGHLTGYFIAIQIRFLMSYTSLMRGIWKFFQRLMPSATDGANRRPSVQNSLQKQTDILTLWSSRLANENYQPFIDRTSHIVDKVLAVHDAESASSMAD
jgi:hypothetical protein